MNAESIFRYALTGLILAGAVAMLILAVAVPDWYIAVVSLAVGNTFRLQVTKPTNS